ncbi:MAG: curli production assembly/transport protein CsgE [Gammaproteobacteria bacterium]|nr:curli production assembly/transport protein CsgE [Gammaproteobacteria bacterium]
MTMHLPVRHLMLLVFTVFISPTFASGGSLDIKGLILDRTITLDGHSFYKKFSAHWLATNLSQPHNLIVTEKPSARWGNLIIISSQGQMLYRTSIRPGKQLKKNKVYEAAITVSQNIVNRLIVKNTSQDIAPTGY